MHMLHWYVGILQFVICKPIKTNTPWDDYG